MTPPRHRARTLYLLALFQLVAGPLVLMTVLTFCKVAVREMPEHGVAKAVWMALQSDDVQAVIHVATGDKSDSKSPLPAQTKAKTKMVAIAWHPVSCVVNTRVNTASPVHRVTAWTPAWPQAPPGTPPRVA